jgi:2-keto-3-deoxy-L-rhamnonate aldolase RhmA
VDKIQLIQGLLANARKGAYPMGFMCGFDNPEMVEVAGASGFEWTIIDQEHTVLSSPRDYIPLLRAAELYDMVTLVKLNGWDPIAARDAFDGGACGIQVPFVESLEMLQEVVSACTFRPLGTRGYCPVSRATKFDESEAGYNRHLDLQNEHILIIPMIETEDAVSNIDEMLANSPRCPIFAIGPEDLRMSLGVSYDVQGAKYMMQVLTALAKKIHAAGKLNMIPLWGPSEGMSRDDVAHIVELHHNHLPYVLDGGALRYGYAETMQIRKVAQARREKL